MNAMRFDFRHAAVLLVALLLAACATGPRVRTDYDPSADFSRYRTWGFYKPIAMEESGYSTWISDRIKDDVRREMEARGYRYVESDPDLQVNFQGFTLLGNNALNLSATNALRCTVGVL